MVGLNKEFSVRILKRLGEITGQNPFMDDIIELYLALKDSISTDELYSAVDAWYVVKSEHELAVRSVNLERNFFASLEESLDIIKAIYDVCKEFDIDIKYKLVTKHIHFIDKYHANLPMDMFFVDSLILILYNDFMNVTELNAHIKENAERVLAQYFTYD